MYASVCVLSYERLGFLKDCLASMMTRADADFELIVHDDGSEDKELRRWLVNLSEEGVISHLMMNPPGWNEGQGIAMNRMAAVAKGDPIIKCDQDLIFSPGWLKKVQAVLEANHRPAFAQEGMGCVHSACPKPEPCHRDCEDRPPLIGALGIFRYPADPVQYEKMLLVEHGDWQEHRDFVGSFIAMPRLAWEVFGPWSERSAAFAEDYEFKMKVAEEEGWCCALTTQELAVNQGFGVGPSTLVLGPEEVKEIKPGPKVYEPQGGVTVQDQQRKQDDPPIEEVVEEVQKVLDDVERDAAERKERRRPRWMRESSRPTHRLDPEARRERRTINEARRWLRGKVRRRRRHGRPVGR